MSRSRGRTVCDCGLDFAVRRELGRRRVDALIDGATYLERIGWVACPYEVSGYHEKATLFAQVICPLCLTEFVGWFHPPHSEKLEGPKWRIYDTSYWWSYNDEPDAEDKQSWRDPVKALAFLNKNWEGAEF